MNKIESLSRKNVFCKVWLNLIGIVVFGSILENRQFKKKLNFVPLDKGVALLEFPVHKDALSSLAKISLDAVHLSGEEGDKFMSKVNTLNSNEVLRYQTQ